MKWPVINHISVTECCLLPWLWINNTSHRSVNINMPFARLQVLLWKFPYQNPCNIYTNMHRKWILFPAL